MTTEKEFEELILRYFRKEIGHYYPSFNSDSGAWTDFITELEENCLDKQKVRDAISDMSCHQAPNVCECCKELENLKRELDLDV